MASPLSTHLKILPGDLVNALETEFQKLHQQYFLGRWEPSQLDGARFAEAVIRVVEFKNTGTYTPIGDSLNRQHIVQSAERSVALADSLRFQIPRLAGLMLDFRNNRNVAHLGAIDVNEMDSTFVLNAANWVVAELIRLETSMSPDDAQDEIKKIIERKVPIIEEIGGRLKILDPALGIRHKILSICYQKYPNEVNEEDLLDWTEYDSRKRSRLRNYLKELNSAKLIDYRDGVVVLTKRGLIWVEANINFELDL